MTLAEIMPEKNVHAVWWSYAREVDCLNRNNIGSIYAGALRCFDTSGV